MQNIAPLSALSNALDTGAKFFRVMVKAGVTIRQIRRPIDNKEARENLAAYLAAGCPRVPESAKWTVFGYEDGRNFSSILEQSGYDRIGVYVDSFISMAGFATSHDSRPVKFEEVVLPTESRPDDVLAVFEERGLERPTVEDALRFGEMMCDRGLQIPGGNEIVFLHEKRPDPYGFRDQLRIRNNGWGLSLEYNIQPFSRFPAGTIFIARRP